MDTNFPKARKEAKHFARHLHNALSGVSPVTEVATVSDTAAHLPTGQIVATVRKGPIQVIGVPLNTVVPGMQIFARKMVRKGIPFYVFDGYAPIPSNFGSVSGSLSTPTGTVPGAASSSVFSGGHLTSPATTTITGGGPTTRWLWSFCFYVPSLPSPG